MNDTEGLNRWNVQYIERRKKNKRPMKTNKHCNLCLYHVVNYKNKWYNTRAKYKNKYIVFSTIYCNLTVRSFT